MLIMSRIRHAAIWLGAGQKEWSKYPEESLSDNNQLSRLGKTLAELPFIGDQVVLLKPRPGRWRGRA
jgi:hypothetical protein